MAGTFAANSFAYSLARMNWSQMGYTVGMIGEQAVNSGGFLYTLLLNPAAAFLVILEGPQTAGSSGILGMYGSRNGGFILNHWIVCSAAAQLLASALLALLAVKMVRKRGIGRNV